MNDKNFIEQLKNYQDRVKEWLIHDFKKRKFDKEQNTTIKFVVPLFTILGWLPHSKEMEFEYALRHKSNNKLGRVDIALYAKDSEKPTIFVEIKRIQENLGSGRQLLRYLNAEGVKYGIYTNGREIKFVDNRTPIKYVPEGLVIIKTEDFVKYSKVLSVFSKKSVENGKLDKLARSYHSKEFWQLVKNEERKISRDKREDLKYILRLEFANGKL